MIKFVSPGALMPCRTKGRLRLCPRVNEPSVCYLHLRLSCSVSSLSLSLSVDGVVGIHGKAKTSLICLRATMMLIPIAVGSVAPVKDWRLKGRPWNTKKHDDAFQYDTIHFNDRTRTMDQLFPYVTPLTCTPVPFSNTEVGEFVWLVA